MIHDAFRNQADVCLSMGSPLTSLLCNMFADNLSHDTAVERFMMDWTGDPGPSADSLPLRICGGLHALVLSQRDARLAAHYPPHDFEQIDWPLVQSCLESHEAFLLDWMQFPPQTNEVFRSAGLWPSFMAISKHFGLPLRLLEVGASGGLNLQADRFSYRFGDLAVGPADSEVHLEPEWRGEPPDMAPVDIAGRMACDINPLDPTDDEDALRLRSYVWPDQTDRCQRVAAAIDLARAHPVVVDRCEAVSWLEEKLADLPAGQCTVVYSTVAWQYLPLEDQMAGAKVIERAGAQATANNPLVHLKLEADGRKPGAGLDIRLWPDGEQMHLGRADFHCRWVDWRGLLPDTR